MTKVNYENNKWASHTVIEIVNNHLYDLHLRISNHLTTALQHGSKEKKEITWKWIWFRFQIVVDLHGARISKRVHAESMCQSIFI